MDIIYRIVRGHKNNVNIVYHETINLSDANLKKLLKF